MRSNQSTNSYPITEEESGLEIIDSQHTTSPRTLPLDIQQSVHAY
jgi:hypothetical protein